jgi:hypothetical protein
MKLRGKLKSTLNIYSYARQVGSEHFSSSAKSGQGVIEIFSTLAKSNFSQMYNENRGDGKLEEPER